MKIARNSSSRVVLLALGVSLASCGDSSTPTAPSATPVAAGTLAALAPDGVISLKTPAPVLQSPIDNAETEDLNPILTTANSQPRFVESADFTYRFEVYVVEESGELVRVDLDVNTVAQTAITTSYTVNGELEQTMTYMWRARAEIGDEIGPWSDAATFRTPTLLGVPTPVSPINGVTTSNTRPDFVVQNGTAPSGSGPVIYEFQLDDESSSFPHPSDFHAPRSSGTQTTAQFDDGLVRDMMFYWRVRATDGTFTTDWSAAQTFRTPVVTAGPRTPDPPSGQLLPVPNHSALVSLVTSLMPGALADSCQPEGGTWDFLDAVVDRLRLIDTRWGYNCKRGNCADPSHDVVAYHAGAGPEVEGAGNTRTVDVIAGHCGPNPGSAWGLQDFGSDARWTSRGRF